MPTQGFQNDAQLVFLKILQLLDQRTCFGNLLRRVRPSKLQTGLAASQQRFRVLSPRSLLLRECDAVVEILAGLMLALGKDLQPTALAQ